MKAENLEVLLNGSSSEFAIDADDLIKESHLLNLLPAAVYVCDMTGAIRTYNRKAVELWGREPKLGDGDERFSGALRIYLPDGQLLPHHETYAAACLMDGKPRNNMEIVIERPDLTRITVNLNIVPVMNASGTQIGMLNCFHDITEQKNNERELNRKRYELQDYVENATIGLHWVNKDGIIIWANRSELEMLGYSEEEYVGHHISEFHTDEAKTEDILKRLCNNESLRNYESSVRCKDGSVKIVSINSSVFQENGKFIHTRCFTVDITQQKQYLKALEESEDRFRMAVDSTPMLLWMADIAGERIFYNKSWVQFTGLSADGGTDWQDCLHPEDRASYLKAYHKAFQTEKDFKIEYRLKRKDGIYRWMHEHGVPRYDSAATFSGFFGSCTDIEEKRNYTQTLEKEVEKRTRELKRANLRLQRYNEQLEQFTYTASHDLKEPLRKIALYNRHIYETLQTIVPEKEKEYLERSITATQRMQRLIDDLLSYSATAINIPNPEMVDLQNILNEVIDSHKFSIEEKNALILSDPLPMIQGIPFQLKQLFDNIIGNALKYANEERRPVIRITIAGVQGSKIAVPDVDEDITYHKISVEDNGIGFDPEYASKIFNLFLRLPSSSKPPGSGIGLAICKKIVQNHQGYITATGRPGEGATFDIYLPA